MMVTFWIWVCVRQRLSAGLPHLSYDGDAFWQFMKLWLSNSNVIIAAMKVMFDHVWPVQHAVVTDPFQLVCNQLSK